MTYKTTEAHRRASQKYRKENRETERVNTYRRTAKMYLRKHATLEDCLDFHSFALASFEEKLRELSETDQQHYLARMKEQLTQQLDALTRTEE